MIGCPSIKRTGDNVDRRKHIKETPLYEYEIRHCYPTYILHVDHKLFLINKTIIDMHDRIFKEQIINTMF